MDNFEERRDDAVVLGGNNSPSLRNSVPPSDNNGAWEPVNSSELQIPLNGEPGKPFVGPDGQVYCIADSSPDFAHLQQNQGNAIPTPSSIIQMTPIVQPIALVPYASQNQPLLQYDPYSQPPEVLAQKRYKKKPYPLICALISAISAIGIVLLIVMTLVSNASGSAFKSSGVDVILSFFAALGLGSVSGDYYDNVVLKFTDLGGAFSEGFVTGMVVIGIPIVEIVLMVLFAVLFVKYFYRLVIAKSPRNLSIVALVAFVLSVCQLFLLFGLARIFNSELGIGDFFAGKGPTGVGFSAWTSLICSFLALVLPAATNKKAYVIDDTVDQETYYFDD